MSLLITLLFFSLGAVLASFVGVVAGRLYTGQGIALGRSRCDACGEVLEPRALVPILSYLVFRGRALCCGARLSPYSPLSELVLGGLFAASYEVLGFSIVLPLLLFTLTLLAALVLYDSIHQILPPPLLALFVFSALLTGYLAHQGTASFLLTCLVAFSFAAFFAALHFFSGGRYMGLADTPLVFGLALLAGPAALAGLLFSFWIGAGVGILLLVAAPRGARMGIEVPFAPFLAAGFLLAYFTQWDPFSITVLMLELLAGLP